MLNMFLNKQLSSRHSISTAIGQRTCWHCVLHSCLSLFLCLFVSAVLIATKTFQPFRFFNAPRLKTTTTIMNILYFASVTPHTLTKCKSFNI